MVFFSFGTSIDTHAKKRLLNRLRVHSLKGKSPDYVTVLYCTNLSANHKFQFLFKKQMNSNVKGPKSITNSVNKVKFTGKNGLNMSCLLVVKCQFY